MRTVSISFFLLFLFQFGISQSSPMRKYYGQERFMVNDSVYGRIQYNYNVITKDTIKHFRTLGKFQVIAKNKVLLADGQTRGCGCRTSAHGYWVERYRNGNLKEQGHYHCNKKVGTWAYYFENGNPKKVETLKRPYDENLSDHSSPQVFQVGRHFSLPNQPMRKGAYKEWYSNGLLKREGSFEIVEVFQTQDTMITFNPETYEKIEKILDVEVWKARSKKTDTWNYYAENGQLTKTERMPYPVQKKVSRSIKKRYKELFELIDIPRN